MLSVTTSLTSLVRDHASFDPSGDQSKVVIRPSGKLVSFRGGRPSSDWTQIFDAPPIPSMKAIALPFGAQRTTRAACEPEIGSMRVGAPPAVGVIASIHASAVI